MPVPHFNIKITQRSKGKSAVAGAAYQAGEKLFSEYDQKTKNYTCKKEVVYTEIMLPPNMMWAEAMFIYQNFPLKLTLSKDMDKELKELQKQFMPEDTKAGLIQSFLDNFKGTQVCSKLIYFA